ncbi:MAG: PolC-type DNA polymerase III [Roseburia sp.]
MIEDYVVIDLEMTGLRAKTDRILEVAAIRVRGGRKEAEYGTIVCPGCPLSREVQELTGITEAMAQSGREPEAALEEFFSFLGEDVLVGQNVIFDYSFLKQWAINHDRSFERSAVDTLKLARTFLPAEQKKDLESLCAYYGIRRENAHRALDDAGETWQILERLKAEYGEEHPEAFIPRPLQYKAKKQTPATEQQKRYLRRYAEYYGISLETEPDSLTRSEASQLTDRLIAQYGKMGQTEV